MNSAIAPPPLAPGFQELKDERDGYKIKGFSPVLL